MPTLVEVSGVSSRSLHSPFSLQPESAAPALTSSCLFVCHRPSLGSSEAAKLAALSGRLQFSSKWVSFFFLSNNVIITYSLYSKVRLKDIFPLIFLFIMPLPGVVSALKRLWQKGLKFKAILGHIQTLDKK